MRVRINVRVRMRVRIRVSEGEGEGEGKVRGMKIKIKKLDLAERLLCIGSEVRVRVSFGGEVNVHRR